MAIHVAPLLRVDPRYTMVTAQFTIAFIFIATLLKRDLG